MLALAACGASDAGRGAFVEDAERICAPIAQEEATLASLAAAAQRSTDQAVVYRRSASLTRRRARLADRLFDRLDAATVPDRDRDALKAWIAQGRRRQALTVSLARAFAARRDADISRLSQQIDELGAAAATFASRYGMPRCAAAVR